MNNEALNILLVEDDDVAAEAVQRSIAKWQPDIPVIVAEDGMEALAILRRAHPSKTIDNPFVVLLDLNMPRMNGFEFLEILRNDQGLGNTIVFVLTTSNADIDVSRAYHENVAGYLVKSAVGPQFTKLVRLLDNYKEAVRFPPHYPDGN